jgi:hypothetical protein
MYERFISSSMLTGMRFWGVVLIDEGVSRFEWERR